MKKILFPALLVVLGTGTAFATKMANKTEKATVPGYRMVQDENGDFACVAAGKNCSDIPTGPICQLADGTQLQEQISETFCDNLLREIP
ncbi:DUF6520 family protein [Chryseobacterium sp. LC2016-29]|uniref:DUF6520 family protein n=1 Tax=unclassified Chryseobacterium TaxID=2593645 RepID=UPI001E2DE776|nr:DUF6520 family protein [Chryseobacterium sp. LC2016-29]MCD0477808.1 DUF6520 family protein [Chryseobacterium sp. LC2016-29]